MAEKERSNNSNILQAIPNSVIAIHTLPLSPKQLKKKIQMPLAKDFLRASKNKSSLT